jgi:hypothetical protein
MGQLFNRFGLLPTSDVVEISVADLTTGYAGQASKAATKVLHGAKGKVLFIDEAYQLNPAAGGVYMQEVVDAMTQALTSEDLLGQLVVILAGYEGPLEDMLDANQGLRSRFTEKLLFRDFSVETVQQLLQKELESDFVEIMDDDVVPALPSIAQKLTEVPNFGNGRDIKTLAKRVFREFAKRTQKLDEESPKLCAADIQVALQSIVNDKKKPPSQAPLMLPLMHAQQQQQQQQAPPPPPVMATITTATRTEEETKKKKEEEEEEEEETTEEAEETPRQGIEAAGDFPAPPVGCFEIALQALLEEKGWHTAEGVAAMAGMSMDSPEMQAFVAAIAKTLSISLAEATALLESWQTAQEDVEEKLRAQQEEVQKAKLQRRKALVPIWRCAVCGRADMPFIACYVSPYIVRYEEREV